MLPSSRDARAEAQGISTTWRDSGYRDGLLGDPAAGTAFLSPPCKISEVKSGVAKVLNQEKIRYVKVFGERNTGTNFLNELLKLNIECRVLENGGNSRAHARLATLRGLDRSAREIALERLIDIERRKDFFADFGWKHSSVNPRALAMHPLAKETLFVYLVRNPFKFILSLYRRPYNLFPRPAGSLLEFINSPIVANIRDGLQDEYLESPVELWNAKVASYRRALDGLPLKSLLIFYEALVQAPEKEMERIGACGVAIKDLPIQIPFRSTKGDPLTFRDYRDQTAHFRPLDHLSLEEAGAVASRLTPGLITGTPYVDQVEEIIAKLKSK